ncbi:hypothetical protein FA15DRAFT_632705 [Coprinopsis marcescibilis]|uniref:WSC domain-containing protein n=1 Tax=Coprinopsis marcescibilis TaxID=230819 RepID=A0A5C3L806_COPMA|nr:hypothetical protein FA15DRAFT_632705 [Coprinopsis marcescibilis]
MLAALPLTGARLEQRKAPRHVQLPRKQVASRDSLANGTVPWGDDPSQLVKRDGTKWVFMHHVRFKPSRYPYTELDWEKDITEIHAKGVDALALNIGSSQWQRGQVETAYRVAQKLKTNLKIFFSFDFAEMACDLNDLVARVRQFRDHPNQFKINGKVFVSSYSGDCLGNAGWASLKAQTNAYLMPFIWGLEGRFSQWPSLDSWYCWGCAWPQGNHAKNTNDDLYYISQLGSRYATTVSMWMFTHLASKNFYLRGDDWLINSRWEQLVGMRDQLTFIEMLTWNDYGESDYFGPVRGAQPAGTYWADGFPHTAWYDMSEYYIKAFKTGVYPSITQDVIYFWSRPHPAKATASNDPLGRPSGWDWASDFLWAAVFASSPGTVTLKMGSSSQTFNVNAGVTKLKLPTSAGKITVQMVKNGARVIDHTDNSFTFVDNPVRYNYNAYVGSATASILPTPVSSTPISSTPTSSTPTSSTPSAPSPSSTTIDGQVWSYMGCYQDNSAARVLADLFIIDNANTISKCLKTCATRGYSFGGVEYGNECFCSNSLRTGSVQAIETQCSMNCAGNANEKCGAGGRVNVFSRVPSSSSSAGSITVSSTAAPTSTSTGPTPSSTTVSGVVWTYSGCYPDNSSSRTLADGVFLSDTANSVSKCLAVCTSRGYAFGGVEYGKECFCSNAIRAGVKTGLESACSMNCSGNANEKCGASGRINVFSRDPPSTPGLSPGPTIIGFGSRGCVAEGTTGTRRALTGVSNTHKDMTPQMCLALCSSYRYAGLENGNECDYRHRYIYICAIFSLTGSVLLRSLWQRPGKRCDGGCNRGQQLPIAMWRGRVVEVWWYLDHESFRHGLDNLGQPRMPC